MIGANRSMMNSLRNRLFPGGRRLHRTAPFDEAALSDPRQRELLAYWKSCGHDGRLPGRDDIDPADFPNPSETLPWLCLVEVHREGDVPRFRHRLIGTGIAGKIGRDATGKWFEEIYDGKRMEETLADYLDILELRGPALQRRRVPVTGRDYLIFERLALPLAADGETVDMVLSLLTYESPDED